MTVLIFANGDIDEVEWIRPYLESATAIIAADGGTRHLLALGSPPDIVIGDFDSLSATVKYWLESKNTQFIFHPADKDETDLELALEYAAAHYDQDIWLFGALGGRLDQTLANILLLAHPCLKDKTVQIVNQYERAWLTTVETEIQGAVADIVSLIPLGGPVHIDSTTGLKWSLQDEQLFFGPARGVSNVMTATTARIHVRSGRLLCIHSQNSWRR